MTLTTEALQRATQAKSDQLNSCDILGGPLVSTIVDVRQGNSDQPVIIDIDSWPQPWKPSKTSLRVLCACWGNDPQQWIGRVAVLICDETVLWAGQAVGGIRTSHLSHIDGTKTIMVNATRGKKKAEIVEPYQMTSQAAAPVELDYYPEESFETNLTAWIKLIDDGKKTAEQIIANIEKKAKLTVGQKSRIKASPPPADDQVADDEPPPMSDDPFA